MFLTILLSIVVSSIFNIVSNSIEYLSQGLNEYYSLQYTTQLIFLLLHSLLAPMFCIYINMINKAELYRKKGALFAFLVPLAVVWALLLTNSITHAVFYYNNKADFVRGTFEPLIYAIGVGYALLSLHSMFMYKESVTRSSRIALYFCFSFAFLGIVVQMINPEIKVELFTEAIAMLGVMMTIENEDALLDNSTSVYNRRAFVNDNKSLLAAKRNYAVIVINMTNFRFYQRLLSYNDMGDVLHVLAKWLKTVNRRSTVYRVTPNNFALIVRYDHKQQVDGVVSLIAERFGESWHHRSNTLNLNAQIRVAYIPEEFNDTDMILELAEETTEIETTGVQIQRGEELALYSRRAQVELAIKNGLSRGSFEVYYQPIWNAEKDTIETAEALLRLKDPQLGFISPDEFIPIAEHNGLITDIGLFVFENVCKFLADERTKALGLHYIELNLSIFQLSSERTVFKFKEYMKKYNISPDQINLEITESTSLDHSNHLNGAIAEMQKTGFAFSLDDYGTGYSNLTYIINMDFMNIKSDKGLLWDADTNDNSKIMLTDTIKMMRRLGMNVIQEGVETKDQLDLVVDAGANLIQGYYFSKPVPADDFRKFVEEFEGVA
ncbi:MAG: GGDEF domain-containing protein [Lachnospiraceae bacterium]|nr:GGDEF domain-containing protein [Lachnospiraceae bacterium]